MLDLGEVTIIWDASLISSCASSHSPAHSCVHKHMSSLLHCMLFPLLELANQGSGTHGPGLLLASHASPFLHTAPVVPGQSLGLWDEGPALCRWENVGAERPFLDVSPRRPH